MIRVLIMALLICAWSCASDNIKPIQVKDPIKKESKEIESPIKLKFSKSNAGHRLGGDVIKSMVENTLEVFNAAVDMGVDKHKSFKYWEFDVHETKDNVLIVHHDKDISKGNYIKKMTYAEILLIKPYVPTYHAVMEAIHKRSRLMVAVEIKGLISDKGRDDLIDTVDKYRMAGNKDIHYLAFPKKFKKSFPKSSRKAYCKRMKTVMRARAHWFNLCR